ncbi:MAG: efflux RND transporter periplasmic adaptor subunit [Fimbriiglobus sp.]
MPTLFPVTKDTTLNSDAAVDKAEVGLSEKILLTTQAQKNLRITSGPLKPEVFWKTISVPGMVIDRPGYSDRGVVAPVTGVVSRIHKIAGNTARPGEVLFTLKLLSESLHLTQTDLFKSAQDIKLAEIQIKRLRESSGAIPEARIIEVDNQITRLEVAVKAYKQELLNRGVSPEQIEGVTAGKFVSEIPIFVPNRPTELVSKSLTSINPMPAHDAAPSLARILDQNTSPAKQLARSVADQSGFEVEELKVELGQQVQAGQTLCLLANHQMLAVEGRAFRDESILLERVVKEGWPVEVDFEEEPGHGWGNLGQTFRVTYIANTIDAESRTFRFLIPLDNQSRTVETDAHAQTLWRFRPGQRVRLLVRVEKLDNVFVLPSDAVARDGADTYVFRQNGDIFDRKPVQVVYRDRQKVVVANDGSVPPGIYVIQTGAAQLNRMVKSQSGTAPKGFHIHADGSVHMGKH